MTETVSLALQQLSQQWRDKASTSCEEADRIRRTIHAATDAEERCLVRAEVWRGCAEALDTLRGQLETAQPQSLNREQQAKLLDAMVNVESALRDQRLIIADYIEGCREARPTVQVFDVLAKHIREEKYLEDGPHTVAAPSATGDAPTPDRPLQVCHDALVEARHRIAELEAALSVDKGSTDERLTAIRAVILDIRRRKPEDGRWKSGANWSLVADDLEYLLNRVVASDGWRDIASKEKA